MTCTRTALGAALAILALGACGARPGARAQQDASAATRAVYADDPAALRAVLDAPLAQTVTREQVGALSDRMHALGAYRGLTRVIVDPSTHEYTFRAGFRNGDMNVVVKLDPNGKLGAYRLFTGS